MEEEQTTFRGGPVGRAWRRSDPFGEGREGAWRRKGFTLLRVRGGPGVGVAEEAFRLRFRGGPGKGVAEEDMGAGRRAAAEGC